MLPTVKLFIDLVQQQVQQGLPLDDAARRVATRQRELAAHVLARIGSWPSSEPELRALQRMRS